MEFDIQIMILVEMEVNEKKNEEQQCYQQFYTGKYWNLLETDFNLIIMNIIQEKVFRNFGTNHTSDDFIICSLEDENILSMFFSEIDRISFGSSFKCFNEIARLITWFITFRGVK